jgi:hypothetical protein
MNYRLLALAIAALSSAHITTAAAQSVYVAPGGVYIGGGPVYVIPAPSNGNGYGNAYGYGNGYGPPPPAFVMTTGVGARGVGVRPGTPANRGGPVNRVGRR